MKRCKVSDAPKRATFDVTLRIKTTTEYGLPDNWDWATALGLQDGESVTVVTVREVQGE